MADILVLASFDLAAIPLTAWLAGEHRVRAILGRNALNGLMPSDTREILAPLAEWAWADELYTSAETIRIADGWAERQAFDAVVCLDEFGLITAARLRRRLGVKNGQSVESAVAYRRKDVMHSLVRDDLPVPGQEVVGNAFDLLEAVDRLGLPAVLKPLDSAGGMGNLVLSTRADVDAALAARGLNFPPVIVQSFIPGAMFHVDGFVDAAGQLWHPCVSAYGSGPLGFLQGGPWALTSSMIDPDHADWAALTALTQQVVAQLPAPGGAPVHAEFFQRPDGEFVFCEIASRAGGAGVVGAYRHALGLNLFELHARAQAGDERGVSRILDAAHEFRPHGWYLRPPATGALLSLPVTCEVPGVVDYTVFGRAGQRYDGAKSSVHAVQRFVVGGPDFQAVFAELDAWCGRSNVWADA
jgi:hypothetical protein